MTEGARVPKLRFQGFNAPWDSMLLSDISKSVYGGGTPDTSNPSYWNGDIPWIQSSDIIENSPFYVKINKYVTNTGISSSATKFIPSNSLAVVTRVGVGKLAAVRFSYATSQDFVSLSSLSTDLDFTAIALQKKLQDELNVVQGTSIKGITKNELLLKRIFIPKLEEQEKIGNLLKVLYKLIDQQQQKHQKMVELKQAMLQKMFPREGETVPELRFPGFTEPWYEKQFTDAVLRISTIDNSPELPRIEYEDINSKYGTLNKDLLSKQTTKSGILFRRGDVLYGKLRPYLGNWLLADFTGIAVGDFWILRPLSVTSEFLYCLIQSKKFQLDTSVSAGSKMPRADWSLISQKMYRIPSLEEQEAIGQFFTALDDRIAKQSRRVDKLKQLKQALLEKMFV